MQITSGAIALLVCVALELAPQDTPSARQDPQSAKQELERLQTLTDAELEAELRAAEPDSGFGAGGTKRDRCLTEIVRRGGAIWRELLAAEIAAARAGARGEVHDLELLTALRRIEGDEDPLTVVLMNPRKPKPGAASVKKVAATYPGLPVLPVALRSQLRGKESVTVTDGGDYRGGREARWRVELRDAEGKVLPAFDLGRGMGGGMFSRRPLAAGDALTAELWLSRFAQPLHPGTYTLRVLYHDEVHIAGLPNVAGLVVSSSEEVPFEWKPKKLKAGAAQRRKAEGFYQELIAEPRVRLTERCYRDGMKFDWKPSDPFERMYQLGWAAIPTLVEHAEDADAPANDRAWAFALLYSLTGINDPRLAPGTLGDYEVVVAPVGSIISGHGTSSGGRMEKAKQDELAARWRVVLGHLESGK